MLTRLVVAIIKTITYSVMICVTLTGLLSAWSPRNEQQFLLMIRNSGEKANLSTTFKNIVEFSAII